jgi:hypothetical protein
VKGKPIRVTLYRVSLSLAKAYVGYFTALGFVVRYGTQTVQVTPTSLAREPQRRFAWFRERRLQRLREIRERLITSRTIQDGTAHWTARKRAGAVADRLSVDISELQEALKSPMRYAKECQTRDARILWDKYIPQLQAIAERVGAINAKYPHGIPFAFTRISREVAQLRAKRDTLFHLLGLREAPAPIATEDTFALRDAAHAKPNKPTDNAFDPSASDRKDYHLVGDANWLGAQAMPAWHGNGDGI